MKNLVIVESPTKSRILSRFLGNDYRVEASMGHIRDLPKSDLGIDIANNFDPRYIIPKDKQKNVSNLRKLAEGATTLWLATDPDREGEAIAWHLRELLKPNKGKAALEIKRVEFHEITPEAIKEAFSHPREIDIKLVDAQQGRRILDRLVGYKLSPLLWKKVKSGLSAGRVQSVAVRLVVEREREIEKFKPVEYWSIEAELEAAAGKFWAEVIQYQTKKLVVSSQHQANEHFERLKGADYAVDKITKKEVRKHPAPPFTTSTLQQTASNRLNLSAKKTMSLAQFLYEHGLITYMRTDSVNLAPVALSATRDYIGKQFGKQYQPAKSRVFKTKSKSAQEAHEAIRPTNVTTLDDDLKTHEGLSRDHVRLYDLIWKRMVASQMAEAVMDQTSIDVKAADYTLRATGSVIKFDGWLKLYGKTHEPQEEPQESGDKEEKQGVILPPVEENEPLKMLQLKPEQHFTEPPPRFNDASLIKKLEELGIGRPSTYAPTLSTIQDRFYVERKEKKFFPTPLGMAVTDFLMKNFSGIIDYTFTAQMESELDQIAEGNRQWQPVIGQFYEPFAKQLESTGEHAERVKIASEKVDKNCPKCGKSLQVKFGKFGKFLACSGFPDCDHTEAFETTVDVPCPQDGGQIVMRKTKKGRPFYGCKNWPTCTFASWTKPLVPEAPKPEAVKTP